MIKENLLGVIPRLQALEELNICEATEFRLRQDGILKPIKLRRKVYYRISDIQAVFTELLSDK